MSSPSPSPELYTPLNLSKHEIRVITILPSTDNDTKIVCGMMIKSLNTLPRYNALSYCWGEEPEGPAIEIMGTKLKIKPNLFAALKHLRHQTETTLLWVDAICINQRDLTEREQQVSMMGLIYEQAEIVYAWLGEEMDDSAEAMGLLQLLQKAIFENRSRLLDVLQRPMFARAWQALITIFRRPYWTRVWIVQEVLLAKNVMVCCGRHRFAWPTLALLVMEILPKFHAERVASIDDDEGDPISAAFHALGYLAYDIDKLSRLSLEYQERIEKAASSQASSGHLLDFLNCLALSRWRWAGDERDHVYSVLSLSKATYIRPSYRDPTDRLFSDIVVRHIEAEGTLDILSGCKHFAEEERDFDSFSTDMASQLRQNELLLQDLVSSNPSLPTAESLGIGQHPLWYTKSAEYLQSHYQALLDMARAASVTSGPTNNKQRGSTTRWPLDLLKSLLENIRISCRNPDTTPTLQLEEFEIHLHAFLTTHREYCLRRLLNAKLPTWTPNWILPPLSPQQNILLWDKGPDTAYRAAGATRPQIRYDQQRKNLIIGGVLADQVAHIPRPSDPDRIKEYWDFCLHFGTAAHVSPYGGTDNQLEAFRKLLSLGRERLSLSTLRHVLLEEGQLLHHAASKRKAKKRISESMLVEANSIYKAWIGEVGRQLFMTRSGYYGAGPAMVREGDLVVIPFGGKVPLLLRPNGDLFYLVEECYLEGFMYGELFTKRQHGGRVCEELCLV